MDERQRIAIMTRSPLLQIYDTMMLWLVSKQSNGGIHGETSWKQKQNIYQINITIKTMLTKWDALYNSRFSITQCNWPINDYQFWDEENIWGEAKQNPRDST